VVLNFLINFNVAGFGHVCKTQIESFCLALFNKCYNSEDFKVVIRDYLINIKSFSSDDEQLYEEEKQVKYTIKPIIAATIRSTKS